MLLLQALDNGTVEWPSDVVASFGTLNSLSLDENINVSENDALRVQTASSDAVLVFLGCFVQWHLQNDQSFTQTDISTKEWLAQRSDSIVQFDMQFCENAALHRSTGFFGDLVRTAEYLDNEKIIAVLAHYVEEMVRGGTVKELDLICRALIGDTCASQ